MKMIHEEKFILEDGDNQIVLSKEEVETLYGYLKELLRKSKKK